MNPPNTVKYKAPAVETPEQLAALQALVGRFVRDSAFATRLCEAIDSGNAERVLLLLMRNGYGSIHDDVLVYFAHLHAANNGPLPGGTAGLEKRLRTDTIAVTADPTANPAGLY